MGLDVRRLVLVAAAFVCGSIFGATVLCGSSQVFSGGGDLWRVHSLEDAAKTTTTTIATTPMPQKVKKYRPPTSGENSVFLDKDQIIDLGFSDKNGGENQRGKKLTIDDIVYGYDVIYESRQLFARQRWKGMMMEQDPSDALAISDFLYNNQPDVMIELGTYAGGSAVFFAEQMTHYNKNAHIITIDPINHLLNNPAKIKADSSPYWGTTIRPIIGDPQAPETRAQVAKLLREFNAMNVFLNEDSYHEENMVFGNLLSYHEYVKPCGWVLVQDTKMSRLAGTTGPLKASRRFTKKFPEYKVRKDWEYFVYTQHANGWLLKSAPSCP